MQSRDNALGTWYIAKTSKDRDIRERKVRAAEKGF